MAAAPYGSSLILPISYAYISMMGSDGLAEVRRPAFWNWPTSVPLNFLHGVHLSHIRSCMAPFKHVGCDTCKQES